MLTLHPKNYDYLWTDYDVNFIFTSCYLFREFRQADFVLIYDWQSKGLQFFLSKKQRRQFADEGVIFFKNKFQPWKEKITNIIAKGNQLIKETKNNNPQTLSDDELKRKFIERVGLFQQLAGNYFYTEFFFLEKAEKIPAFVQLLQEMGKLKLQAREVLNEFYNYTSIFKPYIEELKKRKNRNDVEWLSFSEILDIINGKNVPVSGRNTQDWVLAKTNDWKIILGKDAEKIKHTFEHYFFNNHVNELKGLSANPGIYQGKVKIIKTVFSDAVAKEIQKIKKGDVLIANTTGPEIMAACMKAGAIVTDEGGLTSHAAIVSRELGIPCIVGTKLATKIFKDGDIIEVDAQKGIVRKLH